LPACPRAGPFGPTWNDIMSLSLSQSETITGAAVLKARELGLPPLAVAVLVF